MQNNGQEGSLHDKFKTISEQISGSIQELGKSLTEIFNGFLEASKQIPPVTKKVIMELHSMGWYAYWVWEWGLSEVFELLEITLKKDAAAIDSFMCSYIDETMDDIQETLSERFPERYRLLKFAFAAHAREEYALSIPVFLAQAEGMSVDILGKRFFSTRQGEPATSAAVSGLELDEIDAYFLDPLKAVGPINAQEKDKELFMAWFNRHEVLHGVTTTYDSRTNSYKSIALLKYLSGFVYNAAQKTQTGVNGDRH